MKILPDTIDYSALAKNALAFLWLFITFPFWFLVLFGVWSAREVWSFVGFAVYISVFLIPFFLFSTIKRKTTIVGILLGVALIGSFARAITLPDFPSSGTKKFESVFLDGASPLKYSPWFFFSERDLIRIGSGYILGFFPEGRNLILRDGIAAKYDAMAEDPDFGAIWSEYIRAFDDMSGIQHEGTHYYRYTPNGGGGERLVVFLHGAMGNFMMYPWMFRDLSERSNSTMVYVSYGYGEWARKGGTETIKRVIDNELETWKLRHPEAKNTPEITLIALSRGGMGFTRFLVQYPGLVKYASPISSVLEPEIMNTEEFISSIKKTPLYALHGRRDADVGVAGIYTLDKIAHDNQLPVKILYIDDGDHFTMFDHQKEFDDMMIGAWKIK